MENVNLSIELHSDGIQLGAYLSDDIGGSGISVAGSTAKEVAAKLASYIEDYLNEIE